MGRTGKYYPSTAFLPSVALGALLTPSCLAQPRTTSHCHARLRTPENACVFQQSRSLVVPSSRRLVGALPSHSQSFPDFLSRSHSFSVPLSRLLLLLKELRHELRQVAAPVAPHVAALALDIGVGVALTIEQCAEAYIVLIQEVACADSYPVELRCGGKLRGELLLQVIEGWFVG